MKSSKVLLNIMSVVCFLYGALYSFTLVFIPIGVYCFIAGRRFSFKAEHLDDKMFLNDQDFKSYVIFSSIVCFPLGLLSIIPYMILTNNNVKISTQETTSIKVETIEEKEESQEETKTENNEEKSVEEVTAQKEDEMTDEEKQAKFKKLQNFRDKGIITEEELELAREQLFGKK